jgi:hypothetical protein
VKIKVEREYETAPWLTPNYVNIKGEHDSIPLKEVSAADLSLLCDEWRASVFKAAGKPDPRCHG